MLQVVLSKVVRNERERSEMKERKKGREAEWGEECKPHIAGGWHMPW